MKIPSILRSSTGKRAIALLISTVLLVICTVGTSLAILVANTGSIMNIFSPPVVRISLRDHDEVTNVGTVPVYVRALAVVNWIPTDEEHAILAEKPVVGEDLEITFIKEGWFSAPDGFFYYEKVLEPGDHVPLILEAEQITEKLGYEIKLTLLSSSIQASENAVSAAWHYVQVNENGELELANGAKEAK